MFFHRSCEGAKRSRVWSDHARITVGTVPHYKWGFTCNSCMKGWIYGVGTKISDAVARSSIVFYNSVSADRIVMVASRLLRTVVTIVILLFFTTGLCKSYWSSYTKAATVICQ